MLNDRLEKFKKAVLDNVDQELEKIIDETNNIHRQNLTKNKNDQEMEYILLKKKYEKESIIKIKQELSLTQNILTQNIIKKRNQIKSKIENNIIKKLILFTQTDEYINLIINDIQEIIKKFSIESFSILVCERDIDLFKQKILKSFNCLNINKSPRIKIGGFILEKENSNIVLNKSFDKYIRMSEEFLNKIPELNIK
ncbi:MAG: hypothetical protein KFW09_00765 [Oscillospiraceae bacterium]|nr:hypothetical protein [Oscillospiraceae bacterium]